MVSLWLFSQLWQQDVVMQLGVELQHLQEGSCRDMS